MKAFLRSAINRLGLWPVARKAWWEMTRKKAKKRGMELCRGKESISVRKDTREIRVSFAHEVYVEDMLNFFDYYHSAVVPADENGIALADYSLPRLHRLARSGVEFEFPSLPEADESTEVYMDALEIKPGDLVFDLGAYAGASSYFLARAVGPDGLVAAFEPDEDNFHYLERNMVRHGLTNVKVFKMGVWRETTTLEFQADGNLGSSVMELLGRSARRKTVKVLSLADAAALCGTRRVAAIKMDVEGAEIPVLEGAASFLKQHRPALIIEPHNQGAGLNTEMISDLLRSYGYSVRLLSQGVQGWPLVAARI
jgi:FkbM family methyltransferase